MLEIRNAVLLVVHILHNGLSGQAISSSQLCFQSIPIQFSSACNDVCVHVTCTVATVHMICEGL